MRQVSETTGNSKTKVCEILHEADSPDKRIFRCHDLKSNLYKNGTSLRDYADSIRAQNIFSKQALPLGKVLSMVREVSIICFKISLDPNALVCSFGNFRQFVVSLASEFPGHLETSLKSELKYLETKLNDLDMALAKCGQLRAAIDLYEKMASRASNYTVQN